MTRDSKDENLPLRAQGSGADALPVERRFALASPVDRFAAAVIDYGICLLPILYLILAPFQRVIREAAVIDDESRMLVAIIFAFFAVIGSIVFYQTMCLWLWGATLGKALMGLRVYSVWDAKKVTLFQSFCRAGYWILSFLFFGVPFIGVSSNQKRRPMHDRATDTIVIAVSPGRGIGRPGRQESALAHGIYWAFGTFSALIIGMQCLMIVYDWKKQTYLIESLENKSILCREVSETQDAWPAGSDEVPRLDVALALYAAGIVDRKCIQGEVESLFAADAQSPSLYLAKSFVYLDHAILSDLYLEKVCELDMESAACALTRIISSGSEGDWDHVLTDLKALSVKPHPSYVAIWAVHQLLRREEFALAETYLSHIPDLPMFGDFVVSARTRLLWGLGRHDEARGAEAAAYAMLNDDVKLELASFMCFEQVWSSCAAVKETSCQAMGHLASGLDDGLNHLKASMAYLRKWECEHDEKDYESLLALPMHPDVRLLTAALMREDQDGFVALLEDSSLDEEFSSEISRRLIERTQNDRLLERMTDEWSLGRRTLAWHKLGATLFNKHFTRRNYHESLKVMSELSKGPGVVSRGLLENAVVAAVKGGQMKQAREIFGAYAQIYPLPQYRNDRAPASSTDFVEAIRVINGKGP